MKRALCLWLPQWPLQRLAAKRAGDALDPERAVILYTSRAGQSPRVAHYAARLATAAAEPWLKSTSGIRLEMPLSEARALLAADSPPHVEPADPLADRAELEALAEWCQRFSPTVAVDEGPEPESLLIDVTNLDHLFGGEEKLAREMVQAFAERGLAVRVAVADTWTAAWALAHFAPLVLAEATHGPAAILAALAEPLIVPAGQTTAAIGPLCLEALRLPIDACALLAELGIERVEQLMALRRSTLRARFGPAVLDVLDRATGAAAEALDAQAAPAELEFAQLLEHATSRAEMIEWVLAQLVERACRALVAEDRGLVRFECRLEAEEGSAASFIVGLYRASVERRHVGELVRLKLERLRLPRSVSAIRLAVLATDRLERRQQEMFVPEDAVARDAPREVAALVDRLSNRLGSRCVLGVRLSAGALPEFACRYEPLARLTAAGRRKTGAVKAHTAKPKTSKPQPPTAARPAGDRPLYLETRPLPVSVVSVAPEGPPMQFRLAGHEHRTARVWGPERIETAWWRTRCVRRDYYQVETGSGQRFWMFRQLTNGRWFLHGEFA